MRPFGPGAGIAGVADLARRDDRIGARAAHPPNDRVALNQLSPKQREALLLRFVYEMEYDDIAVILDATPHAVRKFVSKGLGKLRKGRECGKTMKIAT